jgi:hypothetical protein
VGVGEVRPERREDPLLVFKNLSLFFAGTRHRVRNGLAWEGRQLGYSGALSNAPGAFNLPAPK